MNKASTSLLVRQHQHQSRYVNNNIQCCSLFSIPPRRRLHNTTTARRTASSSSSIQKVDAANAAIKQAFDSPPPVFSLLQSFQHPNNTSGRFGYDALRKPEDFILLSQRTQRRAKAVVERIIDYAKSTTPLSTTSSLNKQKRKDKQVESTSSHDTAQHIQYSHSHESQIRDLLIQVKQVDRLSDLLCSVIDLAELVRNLDPNPEWIKHAEVAYQELCYYMNQLNTHVDLYKALKRVYDPIANSSSAQDPKLVPALTVAAQFLSDFEKSGIHLPDNQRRLFVDLSDQILVLGRQFTSLPEAELDPNDSSKAVAISLNELTQWSPSLAQELDVPAGQKVYIHANSAEGQAIRREHPDGEVRKRFYIAAYKSSSDRIGVLDDLLKKRGKLARLVGKRNYAEIALVDKMAKTPGNVMSFLTSLAQRNRPLASNDLTQMSEAKRIQLGVPSLQPLPQIESWDREYYYSKAMNLFSPSAPSSSSLSEFFSVGTCISGLSSLFYRLYGIHFELEKLNPGEAWGSQGDVVKLAVIDEQDGKIGEIYCDLFTRDAKPSGAAHYTVRCSRRLDDDDADQDLKYLDTDGAEGPDYRHTLPLQPEGVRSPTRDGTYQLPVVVLTCDFDKPTHAKPGLLTWQEVETLFHEMGHAMHSMIGRTDYHNVAGTRCATDFVELPSILMEHFASSSSVLHLFAQHYKTGQALPIAQLRQLQNALRGFHALESNSQIFMAILDQLYHGDAPLAPHFDSTLVYQMTQKRYGVVPPAPGTSWQTNFGHLYGYGATYYSYLFDRAIAQQIFDKLFKNNPISRENGELYKNEVLRYGGGRSPWECIGSILDNPELAAGDKKSMDIVGTWNVDEQPW